MSAIEITPELLENDDALAIGPNYELSGESVSYLTAHLLQANEGNTALNEEYVCFRLHGTSPYANLARTVEGIVFTNDLNDKTSEMQEENALYEDSSWFLLVVDTKAKQPVGALRVVEDNPNGFSALNELSKQTHATDTELSVLFSKERFFDDHDIDPAKTWDVGTIAILPESRRSAPQRELQAVPSVPEDDKPRQVNKELVAGLLYHGLYQGALDNDIKNFVSLIHTDPTNKLNSPTAYSKLRGLGIPFYEIYGMPPKGYYNDTYFQPAVARLEDFGREMRSYEDWRITTAKALFEIALTAANGAEEAPEVVAAKKAVGKAESKRFLVEILLTGEGLTSHFAQLHKIAPEERPLAVA